MYYSSAELDGQIYYVHRDGAVENNHERRPPLARQDTPRRVYVVRSIPTDGQTADAARGMVLGLKDGIPAHMFRLMIVHKDALESLDDAIAAMNEVDPDHADYLQFVRAVVNARKVEEDAILAIIDGRGSFGDVCSTMKYLTALPPLPGRRPELEALIQKHRWGGAGA